MSVVIKLITKFNVIPFRIPASYFVDNSQGSSKIYEESQRN